MKFEIHYLVDTSPHILLMHNVVAMDDQNQANG